MAAQTSGVYDPDLDKELRATGLFEVAGLA
jgi:hypothetical protein